MLHSFLLTLKRDLIIAIRHKAEVLNPLFFFILITMLFPLAVTSEPKKLMLMGPGIIWVGLVFANMLTIENIFTRDYEDGSLEQMALRSPSLSVLVLAKLIAHWLTTSAPLLLISFVISKFFFLTNHAACILFFSLLLGSPVLTFLGAIGSALTLGLQNKGILLILLVLPLYIPILIFGASAANDAALQMPVLSQFYFLGAFVTLSITFAPLTIAAALRISLE